MPPLLAGRDIERALALGHSVPVPNSSDRPPGPRLILTGVRGVGRTVMFGNITKEAP